MNSLKSATTFLITTKSSQKRRSLTEGKAIALLNLTIDIRIFQPVFRRGRSSESSRGGLTITSLRLPAASPGGY
ncbi:hypothetical protein [Nostoc sp. NMS8]|uniref:hypothetical protein n=1 Tax=Nostoc sp. NMS8 TaxID=2815392 RepID=UPI0025CED996|nr:hypothetical protein [Nostoc sp. NMS8]MBN3962163.1 hypothetical protein [Nostoc sp. NMS8]